MSSASLGATRKDTGNPSGSMLASSSGSPAKIRLASSKASAFDRKRKLRTSLDFSNSARTAATWASVASVWHFSVAPGWEVEREHRKTSSSTPCFQRAVPWSTIRDSRRTPPKRNRDTATVMTPARVMSRLRRREIAVSRVT